MNEEVVLRPEGELDLAGVEPLRVTWFTLAETVAPDRVVVDLAHVSFADATFVGLVVGLRRRQAAHGGWVRCAVPRPSCAGCSRSPGWVTCWLPTTAGTPGANRPGVSSTFACPGPRGHGPSGPWWSTRAATRHSSRVARRLSQYVDARVYREA